MLYQLAQTIAATTVSRIASSWVYDRSTPSDCSQQTDWKELRVRVRGRVTVRGRGRGTVRVTGRVTVRGRGRGRGRGSGRGRVRG